MTRKLLTLTKGADSNSDGRPSMAQGGGAGPVTSYDYTNVAADIATLVADGATPTQAHVTALNGHWTTLKASLDAIAAETGDVYLSVDTSKIVTTNDLKAALDNLFKMAQSSGLVTA
jgi:hypothetical protein